MPRPMMKIAIALTDLESSLVVQSLLAGACDIDDFVES